MLTMVDGRKFVEDIETGGSELWHIPTTWWYLLSYNGTAK